MSGPEGIDHKMEVIDSNHLSNGGAPLSRQVTVTMTQDNYVRTSRSVTDISRSALTDPDLM